MPATIGLFRYLIERGGDTAKEHHGVVIRELQNVSPQFGEQQWHYYALALAYAAGGSLAYSMARRFMYDDPFFLEAQKRKQTTGDEQLMGTRIELTFVEIQQARVELSLIEPNRTAAAMWLYIRYNRQCVSTDTIPSLDGPLLWQGVSLKYDGLSDIAIELYNRNRDNLLCGSATLTRAFLRRAVFRAEIVETWLEIKCRDTAAKLRIQLACPDRDLTNGPDVDEAPSLVPTEIQRVWKEQEMKKKLAAEEADKQRLAAEREVQRQAAREQALREKEERDRKNKEERERLEKEKREKAERERIDKEIKKAREQAEQVARQAAQETAKKAADEAKKVTDAEQRELRKQQDRLQKEQSEQMARERDARDRDNRDREVRERDARDHEITAAREREAREREMREQQMRERRDFDTRNVMQSASNAGTGGTGVGGGPGGAAGSNNFGGTGGGGGGLMATTNYNQPPQPPTSPIPRDPMQQQQDVLDIQAREISQFSMGSRSLTGFEASGSMQPPQGVASIRLGIMHISQKNALVVEVHEVANLDRLWTEETRERHPYVTVTLQPHRIKRKTHRNKEPLQRDNPQYYRQKLLYPLGKSFTWNNLRIDVKVKVHVGLVHTPVSVGLLTVNLSTLRSIVSVEEWYPLSRQQ